MLGQPEDVVTAIFLLVVVNYLMSFQKLGVLLPFLHLALSLGLTTTCFGYGLLSNSGDNWLF